MVPVPATRKTPVELDQDLIKAHFRREGRWARERGAVVRARRVELGLTKIELAERCQIREMTVYRIESGLMVPSNWLQAVMAHALACSPEFLWSFPSSLELETVSAATPDGPGS